jgi:hypothetical protein
MRHVCAGASLFLFALARAAGAQPIVAADVPPILKPWEAWVLERLPEAGCPQVDQKPLCLWPGRLRLELTAVSGGHFAQEVYADRPNSLTLPGDADRWPQGVLVDGESRPVVAHDGRPTIFLKGGPHRIQGQFVWERLPDSLAVAPTVGLINLTLDGTAVEFPERDANGALWLRRPNAKASNAESLELKVFRKLSDGIPLFVDTTLILAASGKSREIETTGALLEGATPVSVGGDLPARLDGAGHLHVQVRGGTFTVSVLQRLEGPHPPLVAPRVEAPWPEQEIWVFEAADALRQVRIAGASPIDPSRTDLPQDWRGFPAYAVTRGARIELVELRRGEPVPPPDRLSLQREVWLDLSGAGFTVRDTFAGRSSRTSRVDLRSPGELGRVSLDGVDQVVTQSPEDTLSGVEVRRNPLALVADSRLPRHNKVLAVGWSVGVERLGTTLHLPPGWTIFGSTGVDSLPGSWVSRWSLMGFFLVVLVAWGSARLLGWRTGLLAFLALGLCYHENGAPVAPWLGLLVFTSLLEIMAEGSLRTAARVGWWVSLITLVLALAPFFSSQIRAALFPQIQQVTYEEGSVLDGFGFGVARRASPPLAPAPETAEQLKSLGYIPTKAKPEGGPAREKKPAQETITVTAETPNVQLQQDIHALIQTGPGIPSWSWQSYTLGWSGPVSADHAMRLFLMSPRMNLLLTVVRLLALALLAARFARRGRDVSLAKAPSAVPIVLLLAVLTSPAPAESKESPAEDGSSFPPPALLEDLRQRLTRPEPCEPDCLTTASVAMRATQEELSFFAEVHAAAKGAWAIPGPVGSWVPSEIRVDGERSAALARFDDGFLRLRLAPGIHRVEVSGPVPRRDTLTLEFKDRPRKGSADATGWEVTGFRKNGPADAQIQLTRRLGPGIAGVPVGGNYPPWLEISRRVEVQTSWRVTTVLRRVSPTGSPVQVRVPLLPGESPTYTDLEVESGQVQIGLGRDEEERRWESTLKPLAGDSPLVLTAPEGRPWSEIWTFYCGPAVECQLDGLPPIFREGDDGVRELTFRPWPGERVALRVLRPQGSAGQTLTVDALEINDEPGTRLETAVLRATVRASREGILDLALPPRAELQEVTVAGKPQASRPEAGRLRLTIGQGSQPVLVRWHENRGMGIAYTLPRVGVGGGFANVTATVAIPESRWLLFSSGPPWGPAVLFWGYLLFVSVVALLLARIPGSPLSSLQWWLLSLGLTQISVTAAALVVGLFFVLAWRGRSPLGNPLVHDVLQVVIVVWAVLALDGLKNAIETGLVLRPEMQVAGGGSTPTLLRWYTDRVSELSPSVHILSLPLWVYRIVMFAWSLWLASSFVKWVGWAWRCATAGGGWRSPLRRRAPAPSAAP